jgi:hypothetical protein
MNNSDRIGGFMLRKKEGPTLFWVVLLCSLSVADALFAQVSFIARRDFPVGIEPYSVSVGDFNGDGMPDLAVANSGSNNVSVLLNNGDGTFDTGLIFGVGRGPRAVARRRFQWR